MGAFKLLGLVAIIPTSMLLAVSFFILFSVRKVEEGALKVFAYVIAALLWLSALLVLSAGIYTLSTGRHPMMPMMQQMMGGPMHEMMQKRMPETMPRK